MGLLVWLLPNNPIDNWDLLNPKKMATMVFALAFIQIFGVFMNRTFGLRMGAILTGFFGGLVSSTATTASLARKSKTNNVENSIETKSNNSESNEILIFLSATSAMLIEGLTIVLTGTMQLHFSVLIVFVGPLVATVIMIWFYSQKIISKRTLHVETPFDVLPILKLSFFIISILVISKILQNFFGQKGLMILTFLVSLFEIHGSVIANVQLHESNGVSVQLLGHLVAISILASYLSKIFLIWTLGDINLRSQALKCTAFLFLTLLLSWYVSDIF